MIQAYELSLEVSYASVISILLFECLDRFLGLGVFVRTVQSIGTFETKLCLVSPSIGYIKCKLVMISLQEKEELRAQSIDIVGVSPKNYETVMNIL